MILNQDFKKFKTQKKGASGVVSSFADGLLRVYLTLPDSDYSFLNFPRTLKDLHILRVLFGVLRGKSQMPYSVKVEIATHIWVNELIPAAYVPKMSEGLLKNMLFLRLTPSLPNMFINDALLIVNVPYHTFLLATCIGLIRPAKVGLNIGVVIKKYTTGFMENIAPPPPSVICEFVDIDEKNQDRMIFSEIVFSRGQYIIATLVEGILNLMFSLAA
ncbi:hypothetical protein M8C21_029528 [Ambrosia artemisiifolia]|uniref:Uncharacterized protein n=1 Tax=Ambrosia artemisiifolia TaxID=4212 RepID=A0AAD5GRJ2_AMBAR|nr:hypothetical protein M8C21_029528 [Ambrosia artemisiifolia]